MMKRLLLTFKTLETMGFFSWKTNDTEKSIANVHSYMEAFEVTMQDDKGNKWVEPEYDGYGMFGGKD